MSGPEWMGRWQGHVMAASGHERWPAGPEFWGPIARLFWRLRTSEAAANDAVDAVFLKHGTTARDFGKHLAEVLDVGKAPNLPAPAVPAEVVDCPLCGKQRLLCIEQTNGQPFSERFRDGNYHDVPHITVVCTCPHGQRLMAAHGDKLPWRQLANADRRRWQPLGGWPGEESPRLAVVGADEEDEIPF